MKVSLFSLCVVLALCLCCGPGPDTDTAAPEDEAPDDAYTMELVGSEELVYDGEGDARELQLLTDRGFVEATPELMQAASPLSQRSWVLEMEDRTATAIAAPEGIEAPAAVEVGAGATPFSLLQRTATMRAEAPAFIGSAWVKAADLSDAALTVEYPSADGPRQVTATHPGGGEWVELVVRDALVDPAAPYSFTFRVTGQPSDDAVVIGPTSLRLADELPETARAIADTVDLPETVSDLAGLLLWTDAGAQRRLAQGSFEEWAAGADPVGWRGVVNPPALAQETNIVGLGASSLKLTGQAAEATHITPENELAPATVRGKRVIFSAWVYTDTPENVLVRVVDSWKTYHQTSATEANQWHLLVAEGVIAEDSTRVLPMVSLEPSDPPAVAFVDAATLVVEEAPAE